MRRLFFVLLAFSALGVSVALDPGGASANHAINGAQPMPLGRTVYFFRGGAGNWNYTASTWAGGNAGADALCEGLIRQTLGQLSADGKPFVIPPGELLERPGKVVGFRERIGPGSRAYNMDQITVKDAFVTLQPGDNLYFCTHAGGAAGRIRLDGGTRYEGFKSETYPLGTDEGLTLAGAYEGLSSPGNITAYVHTCWSSRFPDRMGSPFFSGNPVTSTLRALPLRPGATGVSFTSVHGHPNYAVVAWRPDILLVGAATATQEADARDYFKNSIDGAAVVVGAEPFATQYTKGQQLLNTFSAGQAPPVPAGTYVPHLTYADLGDTTIKPESLTSATLCEEGDSCDCTEEVDVQACAPQCPGVGGTTEVFTDHEDANARHPSSLDRIARNEAAAAVSVVVLGLAVGFGWRWRRRRVRDD